MSQSANDGSKYRKVAGALRRQLQRGEYAVGDRLPTEIQLAAQYEVGIGTIRRAVDLLVIDGLISRHQGSGMYVEALNRVDARRTKFVGLVVPSAHYYFPRIIQGVENVTSSQNVRLVLCTSGYDVQREETHIRRLIDSGVDGLIIAPTLHLERGWRSYLKFLAGVPVPYVLIERAPPRDAVDDSTEYVSTDHIAGGYAAVRHLATLGHRRIGFLGRSGTATADDVFRGYRSACIELNTTVNTEFVARRPEWSQPDADRLVRAFQPPHAPSAFVCLGDREAALVMRTFRRSGRRIPGDLSLVGYDDEVAEHAEVPLTAVSPPKYEIGRRAADALLTRLATPRTPVQQLRLLPDIVVRSSSGAPPRGDAPRRTAQLRNAVQANDAGMEKIR